MTKLHNPFNVLRDSIPEKVNEPPLAEIDLKKRLFAYILFQDPMFGEPIASSSSKRSLGGPIAQVLGSIKAAQAILGQRGEPNISPAKVTALLREEYNVMRQSYAEEYPTSTPVSELPQNPFNERIVAGIMHDGPKDQA